MLPFACVTASPTHAGLVLPAGALLLLLTGCHPALRCEEEGKWQQHNYKPLHWHHSTSWECPENPQPWRQHLSEGTLSSAALLPPLSLTLQQLCLSARKARGVLWLTQRLCAQPSGNHWVGTVLWPFPSGSPNQKAPSF